MEDILRIPGLLDRMVEANVMPPDFSLVVPDVTTEIPVINAPHTSDIMIPGNFSQESSVSTNGGKVLLFIGGAFLLCYLFRYEIGYYVLGKPNKKYPS
jgi:hypothetical protein